MYSSLCYYVVAHQDDWQLFYGQQAFSDLRKADTRVVFIYTTAGDAGESEAWWRARERGAVASQALPAGIVAPEPDVITVNQHRITVYDAGSFVSYHMRLPDGHPGGGGFPSTGHASLGKLQKCEISEIAAVDGSTKYYGWGDFCAMLRALIERESAHGDAWVNAADWSWQCSPDDHSDHKATGDAVREIVGNDFNRLWFVTYSTKDRAANLSGEGLARKEAVWLAYKQHVATMADASFLCWEWDTWGAKNYYRRVLAGEGDCEVC
jgi:hypothetical protein